MWRLLAAAALVTGAEAAAPAASGLNMVTYGNTALSGKPLTNATILGLELTVPLSSTVGSAEVTGTVTFVLLRTAKQALNMVWCAVY
jgi:hypothetical protein